MKTQKTANFVADVPDEVITTHILPRLPAKSIGRCRCVSKPWRSFLSTPEFAKTHLKSHAGDPEDLIIQCNIALKILNFYGEGDLDAVSRKVNFPTFEAFTDDAVPRKVELPLFQTNNWSPMVGSCDGLILLKTRDMCFGAILVNPITLEYVNFPGTFGKFRSYGLGYDSCSDDYKVVRLSDSPDCHYSQKRVDVYSVKMKCWRRIGHTPFCLDDWHSGAFLNGCIHWVAGESPNENCTVITIAAFDLAREKFNQIPLPSGVVNEPRSLEVKVFKTRLTLINKVNWRRDPVDVWVMEEYGVQDSWTKLATINWPENKEYPYARYNVSCMLNGDEIIVERSNDRQLLAYNWRTGIWRNFVVAGYKETNGTSTIMTFRKSILSPNSQTRYEFKLND